MTGRAEQSTDKEFGPRPERDSPEHSDAITPWGPSGSNTGAHEAQVTPVESVRWELLSLVTETVYTGQISAVDSASTRSLKSTSLHPKRVSQSRISTTLVDIGNSARR